MSYPARKVDAMQTHTSWEMLLWIVGGGVTFLGLVAVGRRLYRAYGNPATRSFETYLGAAFWVPLLGAIWTFVLGGPWAAVVGLLLATALLDYAQSRYAWNRRVGRFWPSFSERTQWAENNQDPKTLES
jgi:hypothetical protein